MYLQNSQLFMKMLLVPLEVELLSVKIVQRQTSVLKPFKFPVWMLKYTFEQQLNLTLCFWFGQR